MDEIEFLQRLRARGARGYIAGGWVRDRLRGAAAHDRDYVVTGLAEAAFEALFPAAVRTGRAFPVYRLEIGGVSCEVALARRERKAGTGYRGFAAESDVSVTLAEDLWRRDTTMNSMAFDPLMGELLDPYGGAADIRRGVVRATSAHFSEDPVRALRAARQAAAFGFSIAPETLAQMRRCRAELALEAKERLLRELERVLTEAARPSGYFFALEAAGLLETAYPALYRLRGKTQPADCHPEGDAFLHTMRALDRAAALDGRAHVRFAALAHDLGKGLTKEADLPRHYGHESRGVEALRAFHPGMTLPKLWTVSAELAITEHMRAPRLKKPGKIAALLKKLERHPLGFDGFNVVLLADGARLPPYLSDWQRYLGAMRAARKGPLPPGLRGAAIGRYLLGLEAQACKKALETQG